MKKIKFLVSLILFLLGFNFSHAQVNSYAKVTGISGSVLTISNVNETYHTFSVGEEVSIQMQLIQVKLDKEFKPEVWIHPNPVQRSEKINIDFINLPFDTYSIAIINPQGSEVHRKQVEIIKEFQSIEIETNIRMNGLYNIRISSAKALFNRKIIIR